MTPNYYFQHIALKQEFEQLSVAHLKRIIDEHDEKEVHLIYSKAIQNSRYPILSMPKEILFSKLLGVSFLTIFFNGSIMITECLCAIICVSDKPQYFTIELSFGKSLVLGQWVGGCHRNYGFFKYSKDMDDIKKQITEIIHVPVTESNENQAMDNSDSKILESKNDPESHGTIIWRGKLDPKTGELLPLVEDDPEIEEELDKLYGEIESSDYKDTNQNEKNHIYQDEEKDKKRAIVEKISEIKRIQRKMKVIAVFLFVFAIIYPVVFVIGRAISINTAWDGSAGPLSSYPSEQTVYLDSGKSIIFVYLRDKYGNIKEVKFETTSRYNDSGKERSGCATVSQIQSYFNKTIITAYAPPVHYFFPFFWPIYVVIILLLALLIIITGIKIHKGAVALFYRIKKQITTCRN